MFTGIIEHIGRVKTLSSDSLHVDIGPLADDAHLGDSIAVNGVCLTVINLSGTTAAFDVSTETLSRSTLSRLKANDKVNLERAMKPENRFGGHFVLGHIDGTGTISDIKRTNEFAEFTFKAEPALLDEMVTKGSVALDGISLTIARMDPLSFTVALIPATLKLTTWSTARIGDHVNIETDILIKTVKKQLTGLLQKQKSLTLESLKEHGFIE